MKKHLWRITEHDQHGTSVVCLQCLSCFGYFGGTPTGPADADILDAGLVLDCDEQRKLDIVDSIMRR
jgi:hypothetical protein